MFVLAQLSDTHFDGSPRNTARVADAMTFLAAMATPPDAILVTGDVADHGSPAEYESARATIVSDVPILWCPGNHDDRQAFAESLLNLDTTAPLNYAYQLGELTVAMCDSTIPGEPGGELTATTLDWLRGVLAGAPGPVVVAFHHPPVPVFNPITDTMGLARPHELAAVLDAAPNVVAVLTGHAHMSAVTTFAGRPLIVAPSISSVLGNEFEADAPIVHYSTPPAIAFHMLDETGRFTTLFRPITRS